MTFDIEQVTRRQFLATAVALGASAAWACRPSEPSRLTPRERRDLYPEGVASGDPDAHSVLLWTRRPFETGSRARLLVQVAEDEAFNNVVATLDVSVLAISDWTCRVLVGNLKPAQVYWYRFVDQDGNASRTGRTLTAPADDDDRPVKFAFASCQNINSGVLNAYRRMIFEDERALEAERLGFVLHLGDFVYELVGYPEDYPLGMWGRPLRGVVRYPHGEKLRLGEGLGDVHIPATLEDYRALYRTYLNDPDLQDARARWPFVCMWDNEEFSDAGWQSMQVLNGDNRPAQTRKVAANQAWFEYQPARVRKSGASVDHFDPPAVRDVPVERFDGNGFGDEPNNRAAVSSLTGYRALRWGRNLELVLTDQYSYRSRAARSRPELKAFMQEDFLQLFPQEALEILDAGRVYAGGNPPATIPFGDKHIPNFRMHDPPHTYLGSEQKQWFLQRLRTSQATWKIWGNSLGTVDRRVDLQNLPTGIFGPRNGAGYSAQSGDYSTAYLERAEVYATVRDEGITGFVAVCGNSHSFWAALAAPSLPPRPFEPVGLAFVTAAISSTNFGDAIVHMLAKDHPLRPLYAADRTPASQPEPTINLLFRHGVQSCLEYQRTADVERARKVSNPELSPHLKFVDCCGNGYATVRLTSAALECEFVCIPKPTERATTPDGGPLLYRVVHHAPLWKPGERPQLEQRIVEGNPALSV